MTYDLVVIGGGVAGSSLARRMAAGGARVLVVEREKEFHDRIRGEAMQPWGVAEARGLGIEEPLRDCVAELRWFDQFINGAHAMRRDMVATTMQGNGMWTFYHPEAQEILLAAAAEAGAEVRRGASARHLEPGRPPKLTIESGGAATTVDARLVVLSAGRNPALRAEAGFKMKHGSIPTLLSGVLLSHLPREVDPAVAYVAYNLPTGAVAALFPQRDGKARAYFGFHPQVCARVQGDGDFPRFQKEFNAASGGTVPLGDARPGGPLASFECVDVWVEHPYREGVALVGDAAASNDPSSGQGLALALRDARVLSDELLADSDWEAAARRYAERHDRDYGVVREVSGWFHDIFQRLGPEAEARRARALPLIAQDPTRIPDVLASGPDWPMPADARARFFGEDTAASAAP